MYKFFFLASYSSLKAHTVLKFEHTLNFSDQSQMQSQRCLGDPDQSTVKIIDPLLLINGVPPTSLAASAMSSTHHVNNV